MAQRSLLNSARVTNSGSRINRKPKQEEKAMHLVVAAIDFGTTYSGYAYSFYSDYKNDPLKLNRLHLFSPQYFSYCTSNDVDSQTNRLIGYLLYRVTWSNKEFKKLPLSKALPFPIHNKSAADEFENIYVKI